MFQRDIKSRFNISKLFNWYFENTWNTLLQGILHIYLPVARIFYLSYIFFHFSSLSHVRCFISFSPSSLSAQVAWSCYVPLLFYISDCIYLCILYIYIYIYIKIYILYLFSIPLLVLHSARTLDPKIDKQMDYTSFVFTYTGRKFELQLQFLYNYLFSQKF